MQGCINHTVNDNLADHLLHSLTKGRWRGQHKSFFYSFYVLSSSYRLHYAIQAYQEILEYIKAMAHSKDPNLRDNAKIMQHNIFYHAEYRDLFITLLRNYNQKHSTRDLLKDMVETLHLYLSLLEKFNKGRGCMVVQGKRRKKADKKSTPKTAVGTVSPVGLG